MEDRARSTRSRAMPAGLLGMVVLVAAAEAFVLRHDADFTNPTAANWRFARLAARRQARDAEILCFGTSLVKNGVLPRVLEATTGKRAYNLAVFNGPVPASYFLLRRALEAGARPACVVLDCQDGPTWAAADRERWDPLYVNRRHWPELLTLRDGLDLAWTAHDGGFFATFLLSRIVPSVKARFELRENIRMALRGGSASSAFTTALLIRHWTFNRGAHVDESVLSAGTDPGAAAFAECHVLAAPASAGVCRRNHLAETYVRRFLRLADRHGIPVVWAMPPVGPRRREQLRQAGLEDFATRLAERTGRGTPHLIVLDGRGSGYPWGAFADEVHLNRRGATAFTGELAHGVSRLLDDPTRMPRWSEMATYRARDTAVPIEDLSQSRMVLRQSGRGARR